MQGSVENFYKVFDEARRRYNDIKLILNYETFYRMQIMIDNKVLFDLRQTDTNMLFDNAAHKLLAFLRGKK